MKLTEPQRQELIIQLGELFSRIRLCSQEGAYIIVEGRNDRNALNALNIKKNIIQLYANKKPLIHLERRIKEKSRVLILTDFDEEGEQLAKRVQTVLESRNPRFLTHLRKKLKELVWPWTQTIESVPKFIQRLNTASYLLTNSLEADESCLTKTKTNETITPQQQNTSSKPDSKSMV